MTTPRRIAALLALLAALSGCERVMRNMYDQPRPHPDALAPQSDRRDTRAPPPHTVEHAQGVVAAASSARRVAAPRELAGRALLERGRGRYDIYCAPCHSPVGDGDGMIVRRGFPRPESFHSERLRNAPDAEFEAAIAHGYGRMFGFAGRIDAADTRAIVAYVRALQVSQHARLADMPAAERERLERARAR